jgi:hypothetical protein
VIPEIKIGTQLELWLGEQWDNLFDYRPRSVIGITGKIGHFMEHLRRDPSTILDECGDTFISNYLCSLQYVESGWRYGPWSSRHMTDDEWFFIAKLTDELATDRDARDWWQTACS